MERDLEWIKDLFNEIGTKERDLEWIIDLFNEIRTKEMNIEWIIDLFNETRTKERDLEWTKPTTLLIVLAIRSHPLPSLFLSPKLLVNLQPILFILFPSL